MSLRDQLEAVKTARGELTPANVVDEARPDSHPLHARFEWDNNVAGELWRQDQAHHLIRSVRIVYREATETEAAKTVRAYHAVRTPIGYAYESAEDIASQPELSAIVLQDMQREVNALFRRYGHFQEFIELTGALLKQAS